MGSKAIQAIRANTTRDSVLQAGCALLRRGGIQALTMRAAAEGCETSLALVQYHFRDHHGFLREVIRTWADEITSALRQAASETVGLARVLIVCKRWVKIVHAEPIPFEAILFEPRLPGHDSAGGMVLNVLREWINETHRTLLQARIKQELQPDVDLRAVALELHHHLWSHGWSAALDGEDKSARRVLGLIWRRVREIAADPDATLPSLERYLGPASSSGPSLDDYLWKGTAHDEPTWTMLQPDNPLYQAFLRHDLMGDHRNFAIPPDVLPEDVAAAKVVAGLLGRDGPGADADGSGAHGEGAYGEGAYGSGAQCEGGYGEGAYGEGADGLDADGECGHREDAGGEGAYGLDVDGECGYGEGAYGEGAYGEGAYGEGAYGEGAYGEGAYGEGAYGEGADGLDVDGECGYREDAGGEDADGADVDRADSDGADSDGADTDSADTDSADSDSADTDSADSDSADSDSADSDSADSDSADSDSADSDGADSDGADAVMRTQSVWAKTAWTQTARRRRRARGGGVDAVLSIFAWLMMVVIVICGFFIQLVLFVLTVPFDRGRKVAGRWLRLMAVGFAKVSPFWRFAIHGERPTRPERKTVVVSNHVSNADVFLISMLPWEMKWLAKAVLFKVPFVGWSLGLAGDVPVKRGQKSSGHHALEQCKVWLDRGVPVAIFPEGTRSESGELGVFKDGAFRLAIDAGADILPVAVAGTRRALPKHSWKFGRAKGLVTVGRPISTAGMTTADVDALRDRTRAEIEKLRAEIVPLTEL